MYAYVNKEPEIELDLILPSSSCYGTHERNFREKSSQDSMVYTINVSIWDMTWEVVEGYRNRIKYLKFSLLILITIAAT